MQGTRKTRNLGALTARTNHVEQTFDLMSQAFRGVRLGGFGSIVPILSASSELAQIGEALAGAAQHLFHAALGDHRLDRQSRRGGDGYGFDEHRRRLNHRT